MDPNAVVTHAKAWLAEYQQVRDDLVSNIPRSAPKRRVVPRDVFVKINVGGAWKVEDHNGGLEVAVRDEQGTFIAARLRPVRTVGCPTQIQALALLAGMQLSVYDILIHDILFQYCTPI